jgi:hypothetical protein
MHALLALIQEGKYIVESVVVIQDAIMLTLQDILDILMQIIVFFPVLVNRALGNTMVMYQVNFVSACAQ